MQYWIDHLTAVIIGGTILFIIAAMMLRGQDASIESVQYNTARSSMRHLVDMVNQDFTNIGSGMVAPINMSPAGPHAIKLFEKSGDVTTFQFYGLADQISADSQLIEYVWSPSGDVDLKGYSDGPIQNAKTFTVERLVNGITTATSFEGVTEFDIKLRDSNGLTTSVLHEVRYIDVSLSMISPLGKGDVIEETRWEKRIRPPNLAIENKLYIVYL